MDSQENTAANAKDGFGRRQFIGAAAAALLAGVVIQITGCSTDDKEDTGGVKTAVVSSNHAAPHKAIITKAQLDAGGGLTLDIKGSSDHAHTVVFSAEQVLAIKAGTHIMKLSSEDFSHTHQVMFN